MTNRFNYWKTLAPAALICMFIVACAPDTPQESADVTAATSSGEVNVYSGRHYDSDIAIYDAFTEETGIRVNIIEAGGDSLIERIAREGEASPADIFITADAGILWRAEQRNVFRSIENAEMESRVPSTIPASRRKMVWLIQARSHCYL